MSFTVLKDDIFS